MTNETNGKLGHKQRDGERSSTKEEDVLPQILTTSYHFVANFLHTYDARLLVAFIFLLRNLFTKCKLKGDSIEMVRCYVV